MALISVSVALSGHALRDRGYGATASLGLYGVPVYAPAFAGTKILLGDRGTRTTV